MSFLLCCRMKYLSPSLKGPSTTDPCLGMLVRIGEPPIPLREWRLAGTVRGAICIKNMSRVQLVDDGFYICILDYFFIFFSLSNCLVDTMLYGVRINLMCGA